MSLIFILLKIEPNNPEFINLCFNVEKKCFDNLLKKGKIIEAEKYLNEIAENKLYKDYNNNLVPMDDRLEDHKNYKTKNR